MFSPEDEFGESRLQNGDHFLSALTGWYFLIPVNIIQHMYSRIYDTIIWMW